MSRLAVKSLALMLGLALASGSVFAQASQKPAAAPTTVRALAQHLTYLKTMAAKCDMGPDAVSVADRVSTLMMRGLTGRFSIAQIDVAEGMTLGEAQAAKALAPQSRDAECATAVTKLNGAVTLITGGEQN